MTLHVFTRNLNQLEETQLNSSPIYQNIPVIFGESIYKQKNSNIRIDKKPEY